MIIDMMNDLVRTLPTSGEDSVRFGLDCERSAYNSPFREFTASWGRPADVEGCVLTLIWTLATGFGETMVAVWRHGHVLTYLCWRGKTDGAGELLAGACSDDLVSVRFLVPNVMGRDHLRRVAAARNLDGAFRPGRESTEPAG